MSLREEDALPKMALFCGLSLSFVLIATGTGVGTAALMFIALTMLTPIAALIVAAIPLVLVRRTRHLRLAATWLLLLAAIAALGFTAYTAWFPDGMSLGG